MGNQQGTLTVTEVELGWLAGMIDGEAAVSFSVYYRSDASVMNTIRVKPQIIIVGTEKVMMEKAANIIGRLGIGVHFHTRERIRPSTNSVVKRGANFRPLHVVTVAGFKRAIALLSVICPHLMSSKGERGQMMLQYMTRRLEKTAIHGRWATHDADDLRCMLKIMRHSAVHNNKGNSGGPRYIDEIERLLRDIEQSTHRIPEKMRDDVVRTARETGGEPTRDGSAPRVFGGVSRLMARPK